MANRHLRHEGSLAVLVTHDREDAFEVADRVAIMNAGAIEQVGAPADVFHQPASACEVHHVKHKKDGGKTSVRDCVLLC